MKWAIKILNIFLHVFHYEIQKAGIVKDMEYDSCQTIGNHGLSLGFTCPSPQYKYKLTRKEKKISSIKTQLTSNEVDVQGNKFTDECLQDIADQINRKNILITHNFNPCDVIGKTISAKIENGKLFIEWIKIKKEKQNE